MINSLLLRIINWSFHIMTHTVAVHQKVVVIEGVQNALELVLGDVRDLAPQSCKLDCLFSVFLRKQSLEDRSHAHHCIIVKPRKFRPMRHHLGVLLSHALLV